jgi:hypothetical protein
VKPTSLFLAAVLGLSLVVDLRAGAFDAGESADGGSVAWHGMMDVRYVHTTARRSSLYNVVNNVAGTNKLRYGGRDVNADEVGDRPADLVAISQASLVMDARLLPVGNLHVQVNFDGDTETGNGSAGLIEAYAETETSLRDHAFRLRAGGFIPPVSWEHPGTAWTTRYTLTPSAIGTWAGEDLRGFGAEGSWKWSFSDSHEATLVAAGFSGGDQTGWVLLTRGWALHDFQPDLNYTYRIQEGGSTVVNRPFKELDGRLGHYQRANLSLFDRVLQIGGGRWDNNADKSVQTIGSHLDVYDASFQDVGAKFEYRRLTLLAQSLSGSVQSLSFAERGYDADFWMAAYQWGRLLAAGRVDSFEVERLEEGTALTGALTYQASLRQNITLEYARYEVEPPGVANPVKSTDKLLSLNYRLTF